MNAIDRTRVRSAFDRAEHYARNAGVQRDIAAALADRIATLPLPEHPRILEIGCGTGFLTAELLDRGIGGRWLVTDKAPGMVARCRDAVGDTPDREFAVLDGEYGIAAHEGRYDLVCASMAMQWFDDLEGAVARLLEKLSPSGHLVFNTLAEGTFHEWIGAHCSLGLEPGAIRFPPAGRLQEMLGQFAPEACIVERFVESHEDARQFLDRLKLIGAATAREGHRPLAPGDLKRVMAEFDRAGAKASYEVVTCHIAAGEMR